MLHGGFMLVVGFYRVDDHCSSFLADLKARQLHRSKGSFEHVADTMACHARTLMSCGVCSPLSLRALIAPIPCASVAARIASSSIFSSISFTAQS